MSNISFDINDKDNQEFLKQFGLDTSSITEYKSSIEKVSEISAESSACLLTVAISKIAPMEEIIPLIKEGADVNKKVLSFGRETVEPLLIQCIFDGFYNIALELIKAGADINLVNDSGDTPLMALVRSSSNGIVGSIVNKVDFAKIIILLGVDINAKNKNGETALMLAQKCKKDDIYNLLLDVEASSNLITSSSEEKQDESVTDDVNDNKNQKLLKEFELDESSLIKYRADIKSVSITEENMLTGKLHIAINNIKPIEEVVSLIKAGANVNSFDSDYDTPLINCIRNGEYNTVLELLKAGADVNSTNVYCETPIMELAGSTGRGHVGSRVDKTTLVKILILMGANIRARNKNGQTALMFANIAGNDEICKILLDEISKSVIEEANINNNISFEYEDENNQEFLKKYGLDKEAITLYRLEISKTIGTTADQLAIELNEKIRKPFIGKDDYNFVSNFIKIGANLDKYDYHSETPLTNSIRFRNYNVALELIKAGADVNIANNSLNETPLMMLAGSYKEGNSDSLVSKYDLVKILLLFGADINAKNPAGETALMLAIKSENYDICQLLISAGAYYDKISSSTITLENSPKSVGNFVKDSNISFNIEDEQNQKFLKRYGLDLDSCAKYRLSIEKTLIAADAFAYELNLRICNPLTRNNGFDDIVYFIKSGANLNKYDRECETPLLNAIREGEYNIALELIKAGADVNLPNSLKETPLMALASSFKEGKDGSKVTKFGLARILILFGADINAKNINGQTALMLAEESANYNICDLLKAAGASASFSSSREVLSTFALLDEDKKVGELVTNEDTKALLDEASLELEKIKKIKFSLN